MEKKNIDEVISNRAAEFAENISRIAEKAANEEEIRIAVEKELAFIQKEAGVILETSYEFTVAKGRVDSVYTRVIIEYKNPASVSARIGERADSPGSIKVVDQIKRRFNDFNKELGHPLESLFGVGLDGRRFIFVRFRDGKWNVEAPVAVTRHTAARFLWPLFNLGTRGKSFTPENLAGDFGADAILARAGIKALHKSISSTDNPKAQTFFSQWKILFGEVCGYDVDNPSEKVKKLAQFYGVPFDGSVKPAELLFAVHTYYAIFMKLMASQIVSRQDSYVASTLKKLVEAPTSNKLRRELEEIEQGGIFRHHGITNFLEGDLFAWYVSVWDDEIENLIRGMVQKLDDYNPNTLAENPAESRDLLKKLYHQLFPKSVRHDLGEYYTPDWLAEHTLNELGYTGELDKRVLDPACGSGTFLVMAINRIRAEFEKNRELVGFEEGELCKRILANVIGFDLNPLAVMAARTNFLIAIRDLISHVEHVEIPVYLCDSIMTPSEHGGLFALELGKTKELKTAVGKFIIPTEIAENREDVSKYAEQLENCIRNGYAPTEFLERCKDEGLMVAEEHIHLDLYNELVKLDSENRNGVWARIIKNAFAPLFIGQVDYIAGNPPWVNWESLPDDYRQATAPLWQKYDLFRHKGYKAKLGSGKDDISILLTYVAHDNYLKEGGKLGFVITQTVFKTKGGGEGFRTFTYLANQIRYYLVPLSVHDLSDFQPFEGATNRTSVVVFKKSTEPFSYPVPYVHWNRIKGFSFDPDTTFEDVMLRTTRTSMLAEPINRNDLTSPWLTAPKSVINALAKVRGHSRYIARKGVYCPTNAIYWLTTKIDINKGGFLVTNLANSGKKRVKSVTQAVERDFVHRLIRGKDVSRWNWNSSLFIILPQLRSNPSKAMSESDLKTRFPKTFSYFKQFEKEIRSCALLAQFFDPLRDPFYSSYNVGEYTFMPYKVIWKEISSEIEATVIENESEIIIPDHKLVLVGFDERDPAYFLSGVLNSSMIRLLVRAYGLQTSISGHITEYANIPDYDSTLTSHKTIAELSEKCHQLMLLNNDPDLADLELKLDEAVAAMWGISTNELNEIRIALQGL